MQNETQTKSVTTAIWWIRRDLRLSDNQALHTALTTHDFVIPVIIKDPALVKHPHFSRKRAAFLYRGLQALDADLRVRGSYLVRREGDYAAVLRQLCAETGATHIYAEAEYGAFDLARDQKVAAVLPLTLVRGVTIRHPDDVEKKAGGVYTVFTPYKKTWLNQPLPHRRDLLPAPDHIPTPADIRTDGIPDLPLPGSAQWPAGEGAARGRLADFAQQAIYRYNDQRDRTDLDGTSTLSPYLRWGMVSAREAAVTVLDAIGTAAQQSERDNAHVWLSELIWRDFYQMIVYHYPHVMSGSFRPVYDRIAWRNDPAEFEAWCAGKTGYPMVDAAMRQLQETGWMHNRARMIVASFLTKDLLINWQWGERWFMQHLLDGDNAANNGGWQWAAGTGTDAAPYFRIFNPHSQSKKFDPAGDYIRRWVPELRHLDVRHIHEPHLMKPMIQQLEKCVIGRDYPAPIVDHKQARQRTLDAYKQARESA